MRLRLLGRGGAGVALIGIDQFDLLMGDGLDSLGQPADLIPVLGIGRGDPQGQQMAKRIDRHMDF